MSDQSEDTELVNRITAIVREVDRTFERVGGSSRHWVRDCFLPAMNAAGYRILAQPAPQERDRNLHEAWWRGRASAQTIPGTTATGPSLQAQCRADCDSLAQPVPQEAPRAELMQTDETRLDYSDSDTDRRTRDIQQRLELLEKRLSAQEVYHTAPPECSCNVESDFVRPGCPRCDPKPPAPQEDK